MANTRDISTKPVIRIPWLGNQAPNTLIIIEGAVSVVVPMDRVDETLSKQDRTGGIPSLRDAIDLRLHSWPGPYDAVTICTKNNMSAMRMINRIFHVFSP